MFNYEKYGFCPFSNQLTLNDCATICFCEDCDTYFQGYEKGKSDEKSKILDVLKPYLYDINETEIKSHIGTDTEISWLLNWRRFLESELKEKLKAGGNNAD